MQVTQKCKLKFTIDANFSNEVELDVVPLDICGMVLGSTYLYDRDVAFFHKRNEYHMKKDGKDFIMKYHISKSPVVVVSQVKRLFNSSQN